MEQVFAATPIESFLDELASAAPTPGGGAASALTGAMSAALVSMVCQLTVGRPRYAAAELGLRQVLGAADLARGRLLALAEADARAYDAVAAAYKLPRGSDAERQTRRDAIQNALKLAVAPPLEVSRECRSLLPLSLQVAAHGNPNVVSDASVAAELAAAGVRTAVLNLRINLAQLDDSDFVAQMEKDIARVEDGVQDDVDRAIGFVRAKLAPKARP